MDTNLVTTVTQVSQSVQQIAALVLSLLTSIAVLVGIIGRAVHAWKTGNSATAALVSGTNIPVVVNTVLPESATKPMPAYPSLPPKS